jgi:DNA-3-methyladenine glycosylase I
MSWYCDVAQGHPLHGPYHDEEYGFPLTDEARLFERLCLEIFQAGLSWEIVLKKRAGMAVAFEGFDVDTVAAYRERDVARLLADARIIRNRRKVAAVIDNAARVREMRASHGGFATWIDAHHPRILDDWVALFRSTFAFTGGEIVREFLLSIGHIPGAHRPECPAFARIAGLNPPWMRSGRGEN